MTASFGQIRQAALGVLLFAAVLAPVVAEPLGRSAYPRALRIGAVAVTAVLGVVMLRATRRRATVGALYATLAIVAAIPLVVVLHTQTNSFYTSGALFGGMAILLLLHVTAVVLRAVAVRNDGAAPDDVASTVAADRLVPDGLERLPPNEIRVVRVGRSREADEPGRSRERADPARALADALADAAAWLLPAFWILVALGRRHVASGALLLVGVLLAGRCLALLPEVLTTRDAGSRA